MKSDYRDGSIDISTGCSITEQGVTKFEAPRLAYVSEKIGYIICKHRDALIKPGALIDTDYEPEPRTCRIVGKACIGLVGSFVAVKYGVDLAGSAMNGINNYVENMFESMSEISVRR